MTASPTSGRRWRVRVIQAGLSLNGNFYPDDVLRRAVPLFDGARVFVKSDRDHLAGGGKDVRNLIGRMSNPEFVPGDTADSGEVRADFELIDPDSEIGRKVALAHQSGMTDLFGFSIDATGAAKVGTIGGKRARIATQLTSVRSVDLIVEPGAGGRVLDLLEAAAAKGNTVMDRDQIITLIETHRPDLLKGIDPEALSDDELTGLLGKAMETGKRLSEAVSRIHRTKLPDIAKTRLTREFEAMGTFTEATLNARISEEADYCARLSRGGGRGSVAGLGDTAVSQLIEGRDDKVRRMLDALFDPKDRSVISIRECYLDITGDRHFTGHTRQCDQARLREALGSASFGEVLGDAITRRMVAEYNVPDQFDVWKDMADVVPVSDFRVQERTRFGGYGDLPKVAERQPYQELTSPTDEKATYAIEKRGGTESLSLEMIRNDDVGVIQRIPQKLSQSAKRTLSRFVLSFVQDNPEIYDGKALFCAEHGNLGTAALNSESVGAGRLAMKSQTERDSGEKLSIPPSFLWVPDALEEAAFNLFRRTDNQDPDFIQSLKLAVRPVWCWTDTADWCLTASTRQVPFIEMGFLTGNDTPELFIQDSPSSGSMFANDTLTYKVRHIYGGTILDYRGAYKAVVA